MMHITEDTPPDMLTGAMDLTIHLPNCKSVKMSVERSTPMMDLLVQISTAHHLQLSSYILEALEMAPSNERRDRILPYKPNTPIGALDTQHIRVVQKARTLPVSKQTVPPGHQPFESTFRLKVHLPRNQLYVIRVSQNVLIEEIMKKVCYEKNLDPFKYEVRHPGNFDEVLDPKLKLSDYQITEIYLTSKGTVGLTQTFSSNDIMVLRKEEERKQLHNKTGGGVFSLIFKRGKSSIGSGSLSSDNRSISPTHSDESRSVTPPVVQQQIIQPQQQQQQQQKQQSTSSNEKPKAPQRKRRPAPKPPQMNNNTDNNNTSSKPPSQISTNSDSGSSTLQPKLCENGLTICHSRNSSDSSGYHEPSTLSDHCNTTLPRKPKSVLIESCNNDNNIENKLINGEHSRSIGNLAKMSLHSKSTSSLLLGRKKKAAPPPPRMNITKTDSIINVDNASPLVVASQPLNDKKEDVPIPLPRLCNASKTLNSNNNNNDTPIPRPSSRVKKQIVNCKIDDDGKQENYTQLNDSKSDTKYADINEECRNDKDFDEESVNVKDFDKESVNAKDFEEESINVKDFDEESINVKDFDEESVNAKDFDEESINVKDFDEESVNVKDFDEESINVKDFEKESVNAQDFDEECNAECYETDNIEDDTKEVVIVNDDKTKRKPPAVVGVIPKAKSEMQINSFDTFTRKRAFRIGAALYNNNDDFDDGSSLNSFSGNNSGGERHNSLKSDSVSLYSNNADDLNENDIDNELFVNEKCLNATTSGVGVNKITMVADDGSNNLIMGSRSELKLSESVNNKNDDIIETVKIEKEMATIEKEEQMENDNVRIENEKVQNENRLIQMKNTDSQIENDKMDIVKEEIAKIQVQNENDTIQCEKDNVRMDSDKVRTENERNKIEDDKYKHKTVETGIKNKNDEKMAKLNTNDIDEIDDIKRELPEDKSDIDTDKMIVETTNSDGGYKLQSDRNKLNEINKNADRVKLSNDGINKTCNDLNKTDSTIVSNDIENDEWQYQLPSPPNGFRDNSPTSQLVNNQIDDDFKCDSVVTSPELFEKLKDVQNDKESTITNNSSDMNSVNNEEICNKLTLENLEKRKSLVYNRELATSLKFAQGDNNKIDNRTTAVVDSFKSQCTYVMNELEDALQHNKTLKQDVRSDDRITQQTTITDSVLPNFKITTYDNPKNNINIFEDDSVRSNNTISNDKRNSIPTIDADYYARRSSYEFKRPTFIKNKSKTLVNNNNNNVGNNNKYQENNITVVRSGSFSTNALNNNWSPSNPVKRSKSQVALNKYKDDGTEKSEEKTLTKSNSLFDVSGLQSLEVMRKIQTKLSSPSQSAEKLNKDVKETKLDDNNHHHHHQIEEVTEKKTIYQYRGPPAINLSTWTERPKTQISLKDDTDYKYKKEKDNINSKIVVNGINHVNYKDMNGDTKNHGVNLRVGYDTSTTTTYYDNNNKNMSECSKNHNNINNNNSSISIKVSTVDAKQQNNNGVIIKIGSQKDDYNRFVNHTGPIAYRKPLGNLNKNDNNNVRRPHSIAITDTSDYQPPIVRSVEYKKQFQNVSSNNSNNNNNNGRSVTQICTNNNFSIEPRSLNYHFDNESNDLNNKIERKPVSRVSSYAQNFGPVVKGFKSIDVKKTWSNNNINNNNSYSTLPNKTVTQFNNNLNANNNNNNHNINLNNNNNNNNVNHKQNQLLKRTESNKDIINNGDNNNNSGSNIITNRASLFGDVVFRNRQNGFVNNNNSNNRHSIAVDKLNCFKTDIIHTQSTKIPTQSSTITPISSSITSISSSITPIQSSITPIQSSMSPLQSSIIPIQQLSQINLQNDLTKSNERNTRLTINSSSNGRDQLLDDIRRFGGKKGLRTVRT